MLIYIISAVIAVAVIALDQISKIIAENANVNAVIIPELLKFKLSYNDGAAFSFLSNVSWGQTFFKILTIIILIAVIGWVVYSIITKKSLSKWLLVAAALCFGGAVGNLIDRFAFDKVRDFIYLFYNTNIFPAIFNVADIALVFGVIMIIIYLLFLDADAVFKKTVKSSTEESAISTEVIKNEDGFENNLSAENTSDTTN